jgi:putative transposase
VHRKTIKHYHQPGHFHEFTFSCYQRRQLLLDDRLCVRLAEAIDAANQEEQFDLVAYVFMPEHVHLLVYPRPNEPRLSMYLARVKQPTSKAIKAQLELDGSPLLRELTVRERPGKECFRFWQEGPGYDRNIWTPEILRASIDYIHNNPVRRGLCRTPQEWKWSSIHFYESSPELRRVLRPPTVHGLP